MRRKHALIFLPLAAVSLAGAIAAGCGGGENPGTPGGTGSGGAPDGGDSGGGGEGGDGGFFVGSGGSGGVGGAGGAGSSGGDCDGGPCGPVCGNGIIEPGEVCDDGNVDAGDGCSNDCSAIEKDYACPMPGMACVSTVVCGDGKVTGAETCDDTNAAPGDGCDALCQVELGWQCPVIGAACQAAACGDSILAGKEECEDGNVAAGDGCDANCQLEVGWVCPPGMPCKPTVCGDAVVEGKEPCDDGNNDMGDGCTPFCQREPDCTMGACKSTCGDGLKLPGDNEQCEDGNSADGDGCSSTCQIEPGFSCQDVAQNAGNTLEIPIVLRDFKIAHPDFENFSGSDLGIVQTMLGPDGKPVYAGNPTTPTTSGKANFDQWYRDVAGVNFTVLQKLTLTQLPSGAYRFDDSTFFPLNGIAFGNEGNANNFHFTSEVRYWFEYKGNEQLDFTGDDDVWVFVNKRLAVNLGGVHGALSGSVLLNAAKALELGLEVGKIYETVVLQAERHTSQSNYRLTLSNFVNTKSTCQSVCGDGTVTPNEACDDGTNDGSYGSCTPDCKKGPYCGDGIVQAEGNEECDDGVNLTPYGNGCAPGCKTAASCGDGQIDSLFGELCDDGTNDGGYGECAAGCTLGPRCGDGIVQTGFESCDDGNKTPGDGCDQKCVMESPK
ncbi:DUF4215 domain-containing protein [Polyangium sp. y55x31]|uniref:DUF4215 domain-containing protein n=1 Tax=Polyangium sp. y55x31 TaxID=3042688 RepID=UPI0024825EEF|nr:DUF4215 domain-containing protein [Polyangium sp. y55x31]MDI1476620.1 DUF4215 domain-containing protein [Polyangium sp. y55x31]